MKKEKAKRLAKRITVFAAALAMAAAFTFPAQVGEGFSGFGNAIVASAETATGDLTVTGGELGTDYTFADGVLTIKTNKAVTIANADPTKATTHRIEVADGVSANITLAGVNINVSSLSDTAAFKIADDSTGNVTITLADSSKNTLKGGECCAGLQKIGAYTETLGKLTIKGGANGTGKLNATGGLNGAGIGGGLTGSGSNIEISGGTVIATGGVNGTGAGGGYGAGIGGGKFGDGSNITISGGTVTATGSISDAGIGGGYGGSGSNITISGGTVTATGSKWGAGIGGGYYGSGSDITISGGTVTATGGKWGAGIGGGDEGSGSDITISGGTVTATGGTNGAGIGGGDEGDGSDITISGGTVTATGGYYGAGIGGGDGGSGSNIEISGGSVKVAAGTGANAIGGGSGNGAVTPTDGADNVYLLTIANPDGAEVVIDGKAYTPVNHKAADSSDTNLYVYLTGETHLVKVGDKARNYEFYSENGTFGDPSLEIKATNSTETITFGTDYTYAGNVLTIKTEKAVTIANADPTKATTHRIEVADGVSANITLAGVNIDVSSLSDTAAFKIADNSTGNVTITLADGSENTLKSGKYCAGLQKNGAYTATLGKLTIKGGTNGTGKLTATGGSWGAGIGGGNGGSGTNIEINGGAVTATGGSNGAGIGGGDYGSGSYITISGGTVTATGGNHGAGIGGGSEGSGSDITISDGTVTATGGSEGAGIGGGSSRGSGTNIEISGGTVTATGGSDGAGIGGGDYGSGSDITIRGGTVTATGSYYGAGIGGGYSGSGSDITIIGGTVTATGGNYGAGIGGGDYGSGSDITIRGGTVTATGGDWGAGIGGGYSGSGSNITISGGTVTAKGGTNGAGIGGGRNGDGSNIEITGGSVKAAAGGSANAIGGGNGNGAVIPTNGTDNVYLFTISNPDGAEVVIDGKTYTPVNHKAADSSDTNLYVYLTGDIHEVKVGDKARIYGFDSENGTFGDPPLEIKATNSSETITFGTDYTYANGVLTIKTNKAVTIANADPTKATTHRIEVAEGYLAYITLAGVNIDVSASENTAALKNNSTLEITLAEDSVNNLKSGSNCAGLQMTVSELLYIKGEGELIATGGDGGAGIGGGDYGSGSNMNITGGTVIATGGSGGAGIGGGGHGSGEKITITGGTVTATGSGGGAGIGGGKTGSGSRISITGGTVTATGGLNGGAGIGGGYQAAGSRILIDGGTVTATGSGGGAGIGGGAYGTGSGITITGGSVKAAAGGSANAIGGGLGEGAVTPTDGNGSSVYLFTIANPDGAEVVIDGKAYTPVNHKAADSSDTNLYVYLTGDIHEVKVGDKARIYGFDSENSTFGDPPLKIKATNSTETITFGTDYTYANGVLTIKTEKAVTIANTDPTKATTHRIEVADGVYANITLAGVNIDVSSLSDTAAFKNNSVVEITLEEDSVNNLKSGSNCAGLQTKNNQLRIKGEGELIATGGDNGAGIGGGDHGSVSLITILGGTVTATGSGGGAGIGGGYEGKGSNIYISGGTVTATGSGGGAGIGGGKTNSGSGITITGGTVTATGGSNGGAGIGGGNNQKGTGITISGGTVTATGSNGGAGIGGGKGHYGSGIYITGGSVKAVAGENANAIGGGSGNGAVTPTLADGTTPVYLLTIANPNSAEVVIDGKAYTPVNHKAADSSDTNLYAYLIGTTHTVTVGTGKNAVTTEYAFSSEKEKFLLPVTVSDSTGSTDFNDLTSALTAYKTSTADLTITLNKDANVTSLSLPTKAASITITGEGALNVNAASITIPANTTIDAALNGVNAKPLAVKVSAGKTLTINGETSNIGAVSGTKTSVLNVNADVTAASIATFGEVNVANDKVLTVTGKTTAVTTLNGTVKLPTAAAAATVTTVGNAEFILTDGDLAKVTVNNVTEQLTITVVNAEGTEAALASGTTVLYSAKDISEKVTIANKTADSKTLNAFYYTKTKSIKAEWAEAVTLVYNGENARQFPNLELALAAITDSSTDYTVTLNTDVKAAALTLPKTARSITINGTGTLTTGSTSIAIPVDTAIGCNIIQSAGKTIALNVSAGKTLTINTAIESLGAVSGTKTSVLNVNADVTAASLATFKEVNVAESKTLTVTGKTTAVTTLNGKVKLPTAAAAATVTTVGNAEFILTKGNLAKATVNDVTESLKITVVNSDGAEAALASGTTVLYTAGKTDYTDKVTIANQTPAGLELTAVLYTKEIKAEYAGAVTLSYGETAKQFPNLELALAAITDSSTDYTVTLNTDVTAAALTLPKTARSITINGTGTLTTGSTSIAIPVDTAIGCNIIQSAGKTIALNVSAGKTLTINTAIESLGAVSGTKTSVLNVNADVTAASIATFGEVNVAESKTLTVTGKTTSVATLNGTVKLPTAAAAATVTTVGKAEFILTKGNLAKATVNDVTESLKITVVNSDGAEAALASGTTVLYTAGKTDYTDKVTIANQTPTGLELTAVLYTKEIKAECAADTSLVSVFDGTSSEQYQNITLALAAIKDATKDYVLTLSDDISTEKINLPTKANSLTIKSDSDTVRTISLTGVTALSARIPLTLENVGIESTKPFTISASKDLTLDNFVSDSISAVKGGSKFVLYLGKTSPIDKISGFGTVNVSTDFTVGTTFTTTALYLGENAGITIPGTKSTVSTKTLNGANGSYIKFEQGFTPIKITGTAADSVTGTIALRSDSEISESTILFTTRIIGNGVFDVTEIQPAGATVDYTVAVISGKAYIRPIALDLNGTEYALWTDVVAAIEAAKESTADYTITLIDNYDVGGAIKLPKAGTYNSLTITSDSNTLTFTGNVTSTGALNIVNTSLDSAKNGVSAKYTVSAGKYRFSAENVDFNLAGGLSGTGDVTLKNVTLNGTVKAGVLTLNGTNTIGGTVTVTELNSAESGAVLNILNNTRGVLSVTKNGITAGSADITLRLVNADGSAATAEEGAIIASTFKGDYDGQLKLSTENGIFNIVLTDKGKLVLASEALNSTDALDEEGSETEEEEESSEDEDSEEDEDTSEEDGSDEEDDTSDDTSDEDNGEEGETSEGDEDTSEEDDGTGDSSDEAEGDEPVSDETEGDTSDMTIE